MPRCPRLARFYPLLKFGSLPLFEVTDRQKSDDPQGGDGARYPMGNRQVAQQLQDFTLSALIVAIVRTSRNRGGASENTAKTI
jgi:hypothetical protein